MNKDDDSDGGNRGHGPTQSARGGREEGKKENQNKQTNKQSVTHSIHPSITPSLPPPTPIAPMIKPAPRSNSPGSLSSNHHSIIIHITTSATRDIHTYIHIKRGPRSLCGATVHRPVLTVTCASGPKQ